MCAYFIGIIETSQHSLHHFITKKITCCLVVLLTCSLFYYICKNYFSINFIKNYNYGKSHYRRYI